jgi:hypothetical protein
VAAHVAVDAFVLLPLGLALAEDDENHEMGGRLLATAAASPATGSGTESNEFDAAELELEAAAAEPHTLHWGESRKLDALAERARQPRAEHVDPFGMAQFEG